MRRLLLLFATYVLTLCNTVYAQVSFQKSYGGLKVDEPGAVIEVPDGYLIAGYTSSTLINKYDALLLMLDHQGEILWQKTYGELIRNDYFYALAKANGGGYLAAGRTGLNTETMLIVRTDDQGNELWSRVVEGSDYLSANKILPIPDGYIISGGKTPTLNYRTGFAIRIDNEGNTVWSKYFETDEASEFRANYAAGNVLYLNGHADYRAAMLQVDLATGDILSKQILGNSVWSEGLNDLDPTLDNQLIYAGRSPAAQGPWVRKTNQQGTPLWSRSYFHFRGPEEGVISVCADGGYLLMPDNFPWGDSVRPVLAKLDGDGNIDWCYDYGNKNQRFVDAIATQDGGYLAVGIESQFPYGEGTSILVVKTKPDGLVDGCCTDPYDLQVIDYFPPANTESVLAKDYYQTGAYDAPISPINLKGIPFCAPAASLVTLSCPAPITVAAAPGAQSAQVAYNTPMSGSDCPCDGVITTLDQGLASGSAFPLGETTVCYRATDQCGVENSCCFNVNVQPTSLPDDPCDEKTIGCIRYELLQIAEDAAGNRSYRIAVTNTCNAALDYVAVQVPAGVSATAPAANPGFVSESGRVYAVRNPSFTPFNSVRFTDLNGGFSNGTSDVFTYSLPAQAAPIFIRVFTRLDNGAAYETYLNTFNCPVDYGSSNRSVSRRENMAEAAKPTLYPNPATDRLMIDCSSWAHTPEVTRIYSPQGRLLLAMPWGDGTLDLSQWQAGGLYYLEILAEDGARELMKFVVMRD